jgi:hypothetical protein
VTNVPWLADRDVTIWPDASERLAQQSLLA